LKRQKIGPLFYVYLFISAFLVFVPAFAYADGFQYEKEARILNDLGLYRGISEGEFNPDLGAALNRETGIVMLIRIFGLETEAANITNADEILSKFSDAGEISGWAEGAVAYAVHSGLVIGLPDGTFGAKQPLNGKAYCSLILRQLGYTPDYNQAPAELAAKGGISPEEVQSFTNKDLIKDDLVGISYGCLKANDIEGKSVLESLVALGVVDNSGVETIMANLPDLRSALAGPALTPSVPPAPTGSSSHSGHPDDRKKPVASLTQRQDNVIVVCFDESVVSSTNRNGAKNLSNYKILGVNGNFVENAASISESVPNLEFEVSFDSLTKGNYGEFTVCITGISDQSGNIMDDYQQKLSIIPFSIKTIQ